MSLHKAAASTASGSHELHSRMCKKVADLTRVIDKLFKEFYEQSGALRSLQKKYRQQSKENDSLVMEKANLADEVVTCKNELQRSNQHFKELVNCLKVQLADCQKDKDIALGEVDDLQQSLMETLKELEELKAANNKLLMESNNDCISCEDHVESIESLKQQLELNSAHCIELRKEKDGLHTRLNELQSQYERTNDECQQLREEIGTSEERIDALQSEKCNLQLKITHLLKELQELRTITAKREKVMSDSPIPAPNRRKEYWLQTRSKVNRDEELVQLRQELQRYRLELMNRESNFNRVFTEHNPIHLRNGGNNVAARKTQSVQLPRLQSGKNPFGFHR